jgi:hypothetical protein
MSTNATTARDEKACAKLDTLQQRLACIADAGPQAIEDRLAELDCEWTAGRVTKVVIGAIIVAGFALAALVSPWWLILPAVGGLFLLQYVFAPTSWVGTALHRLGFRAGAEVDQEKTALKVLRGDFRHVPTVLDIENRDDISRLEGEGGIALDPEEAKVDATAAAKEAVEATKS